MVSIVTFYWNFVYKLVPLVLIKLNKLRSHCFTVITLHGSSFLNHYFCLCGLGVTRKQMAWENKQLYNYGLIYVHKWVLKPSWLPLLLLEKKKRFLFVCNSLCLTISLTTFLLLIASLSQKGSLLLYLQEGLQTICSKIMVGEIR